MIADATINRLAVTCKYFGTDKNFEKLLTALDVEIKCLLKQFLSKYHLYFYPGFQNFGLGGSLIDFFKQHANESGLPIRLGALRDSRSNEFYIKHGFVCTHEEEWNIFYEFTTG